MGSNFLTKKVGFDDKFLKPATFLEALRKENHGTAKQAIDISYALTNKVLPFEYYMEKLGKNVPTRDSIVREDIYTSELEYTTLISFEKSGRIFGENGADEVMIFSDKLFTKTHIIASLHEKYNVQIRDYLGERDGGHAYMVRVMGNESISDSVLLESKNWTAISSNVSETLSVRGAEHVFTSPYTRSFPLSTVRYTTVVPGDAGFIPVVNQWQNSNGAKVIMFDDYNTLKHEMDFKDKVAKALTYQRGNMNADGTFSGDTDPNNNLELKIAPSIREQLERGVVIHRAYESNETDPNGDILDLIVETSMTIRTGKVSGDESNRIYIETGTLGMEQVSKAIEKRGKGWSSIKADFFGGDKHSMMHGVRFTSYLAPNGLVFDFNYNPYYDTNQVGAKLKNGISAMSAEFTILDMGTTKTKNTIEIQYHERHNYTYAIIDGVTGNSGTNRSSGINKISGMGGYKTAYAPSMAIDGWQEHRVHQFRAIVRNPSACVRIVQH